MDKLRISLMNSHGGIMTNYECTAACRHCIVSSSPSRSGGYMTEEVMDDVCRMFNEGGCDSVHIGGGEPFMDFDGLVTLLNTCARYNIAVEYAETNAGWAVSDDVITRRLNVLAKAGLTTLCISLDPFHAEFVPYSMPLKLAESCWKAGLGYFLWQERFLPMMGGVDPNKTHDRAALENIIGGNYIATTANIYGLKIGGRAVNIEAEYTQNKPIEKILDDSPCKSLLSTGHFHVDIYKRFIPPGCTGIAVPLREIMDGLEPGRYPAFEALHYGGVKALFDLAVKEHAFVPNPGGYTSSCALCFYIRYFLSKQDGYPELDAEHYEASFDFV